jgi:HTH-type transcriptional regulator / antitoxin HipB
VDIRISDWTKLGSVIRDARKARGFSQHQLAERAGVSRSWLARLETGHRGAELDPLFRLLNALELSLALRDPAGRPDEPAADQAAATEPARQTSAASAPGLSVVAKHQAAAAGRRRAWQAAFAPIANDDPDDRHDDSSSSDSRGRGEGRAHD